MAQTQGDKYWAGVLASAFPPQFAVKGLDTAQLVVQIGKWSGFTGPEDVVQRFRIPDLVLPVTRMMKVRFYAILRRRVRGEGVFVKRVRIPWPYVWSSKAGTLRVKVKGGSPSQAPNRTSVKGILRRAYADYRRKRNRRDRGVNYHGIFSHSSQRPFSEIQTSYTTSTTLNEQINAYGPSSGSYTAPIFQNPGSSYWSYERYYSGVRTPNFRTLKRADLPVNPYSLLEVRTRDACDFHKYRDFTGPYWNSPQFGPVQTSTFIWQRMNSRWSASIPSVPSVSDDATYNKALRKAIESTENEISANLAQDFAQFGQTTRLIAKTCNRIVGSIRALRKGNFDKAIWYLTEGKPQTRHIPRKPLRHYKTLADNWLEMQYGWKPLLNDVHEAMNASAKVMQKDTSYRMARGAASRDVLIRDKPRQNANEASIVANREANTHYYCRFVFRYKVDSHLKAYAAQLGFTNPVNLAWEILPFSFVVDWFLPIGPYLETLSAFDGLAFYDGTKTEFMRQDITLAVDLKDVVMSSQPWRKMSESGVYTRDSIRHVRTKLTSFPSMRQPSLKNGLTVTHASNALALLVATVSESTPRASSIAPHLSVFR
jgi:hypothetical protein